MSGVFAHCTNKWVLYKQTREWVLYTVCMAGLCVSRDSIIGIATRYGLDGPGIESRWGARFSAPVHTGRGTHPASCTTGTGSFPGIKRPGRGVDRPPPTSAKFKERVELYLYSLSGPSWPVIGWNLRLPYGWFVYQIYRVAQKNVYTLYSSISLE